MRVCKSLLCEVDAAVEWSTELMRHRSKEASFVVVVVVSERDEIISVGGVADVDNDHLFVVIERWCEFDAVISLKVGNWLRNSFYCNHLLLRFSLYCSE